MSNFVAPPGYLSWDKSVLIHDIKPLKPPICRCCLKPILDATNRVQRYHLGECQKLSKKLKARRFELRRRKSA